KRWKITGTKTEEYTIRQLLYNRGKLGTPYKPEGYTPEQKIPNLLDIFNGQVPAKNQAFKYKGLRKEKGNLEHGGWLIGQLLLEDHYNLPFPKLMEQYYLQPLGMDNSFYAVALSPEQATTSAAGHWEDGSMVPNQYFRYPELANHGLWTTPADFTKFVRHVMEAAKGKENRFLSQALAQQSITRQFGQRSLLFHINEYKNLFWGGATKGFYFYMQANIELDYVVVTACNRQTNWQVCNKLCWKTYDIVKQQSRTKRMGIFYQEEDQEQLNKLLPELKQIADELDINLELLPADKGVPAEITATPAFVFQNERGRSIHAGRHLDLDAVRIFLRTNLLSPRTVTSDDRQAVLTQKNGRQTTIIPLKLTELTGNTTQSLPENTAAILQQCIYEVHTSTTPFVVEKQIALQPTDRRFYLDVHPYANEQGELALSYAIFSQFNCHEQLTDNFGEPIVVAMDQLTEGLCQLAQQAIEQIAHYRTDAVLGESPNPLPISTPAGNWIELGWELPIAASVPDTEARPVYFSKSLQRIAPIEKGTPRLQFNFPAPLDRYAGTVSDVNGQLSFSEDGRLMNGDFKVAVSSLTTSNAGLDDYILGKALNTKRFPVSSLRFSAVTLTEEWQLGQTKILDIPATFTLKNKDIPVVLQAELTPTLDAAGQPQLQAIGSFSIDILQSFGIKGPDGPEAIKNQVIIQTQFLIG
ncbi:MAG: YceI family protein, partial [Bacteroidota bacterium]